MNVYWLDSFECRDPARFGGKAANLARLAAEHPVPPGFCLAAGGAGATVLSPAARAEVAAAYAELGRRCGGADLAVAVRSSAVDEDGREASFAGQHETYLNVVGAEAVIAAVERCLASAQSPRALSYRRAHGLPAAAHVAVLVQLLVVADAAAVVFSADPRTGDRDRVVINAAWGLGESIVGGNVTPDLYAVRKSDASIVERQVAEKTCMTVAGPAGTREVPVPRCMRCEPALGDDQILELACLACVLETHEGWPVDLECAYERGKLYLLQCRPVTAVKT